MTQQTPDERHPDTETGQTPHEREVAEYEEQEGDREATATDALAGEERRPTSEEDLAADQSPELRERPRS